MHTYVSFAAQTVTYYEQLGNETDTKKRAQATFWAS